MPLSLRLRWMPGAMRRSTGLSSCTDVPAMPASSVPGACRHAFWRGRSVLKDQANARAAAVRSHAPPARGRSTNLAEHGIFYVEYGCYSGLVQKMPSEYSKISLPSAGMAGITSLQPCSSQGLVDPLADASAHGQSGQSACALEEGRARSSHGAEGALKTGSRGCRMALRPCVPHCLNLPRIAQTRCRPARFDALRTAVRPLQKRAGWAFRLAAL